MSGSSFSANFLGIGQMLKSEFIADQLMEMAELVKARAEDTAPVSSPDDAPYNKTPGRYKQSFGTRLGIDDDGRIEAVIYNTAPEAIRVEKGNSNIEAHHTLTNALYSIRGLL